MELYAVLAQLVERQISILNVASSSLVYRSNILSRHQAVRYQTLTLTFTGSNPVGTAINKRLKIAHSCNRVTVLLWDILDDI